MTEFRYEATITGNQAPFKWKVSQEIWDTPESPTPAKRVTLSESGDAETYELAIGAAYAVATEFERRRKHAATVRTEELFRESDEPIPLPLGSCPDTPPETHIEPPCGGDCARYGRQGCWDARCIVGQEPEGA